ncbi:MAG: hypothetical protein JNM09_03460 [Blastocatellia bacterium]|nr:hypothetical protein [Blastocatellia bacterium]
MFQRERIVQYVMGELDEAEQLRIEEQYFADVEFLGEIQAVCGDLIDAYLTGAMPRRDRERFEKRLHAIPFLRAQVETSRALFQYAQTAATERPEPVRKQRVPFVGWWASRQSFWPRLAWGGIICGLLVGGVWYWQRTRQSITTTPSVVAQAEATPTAIIPPPTPSAPVVAAFSPDPLTKSSVPSVVASLLLSAELTRSENQLARLLIPKAKGVVRLQVELSAGAQPPYEVVLQTAQGQHLRTWRHANIVHSPMGSVVALDVPARLLPKGRYFVALKAGTAPLQKFPFSVEPR